MSMLFQFMGDHPVLTVIILVVVLAYTSEIVDTILKRRDGGKRL